VGNNCLGNVDGNLSERQNQRFDKAIERRLKLEKVIRLRIINSAKRWEGVRELTNHNDHPMITKAMQLCGLSGNKGYAWCAACQADIFFHADVTAPYSARVVDWFKNNVIWNRAWGAFPLPVPIGSNSGFWNTRLNRLAHIGLNFVEDKKNIYMFEGNTSPRGQFAPESIDLDSIASPDRVIVREATNNGGFYPKIRSKSSIAAMADYVKKGDGFRERYWAYLKRFQKIKK